MYIMIVGSLLVFRSFFLLSFIHSLPLGDTTKNALSHWIVATFKCAYEMVHDHLLQNLSVKPHEIRVILASTNFHDSLKGTVLTVFFWDMADISTQHVSV